jgi:K+-sensing histidine kinase KdpD
LFIAQAQRQVFPKLRLGAGRRVLQVLPISSPVRVLIAFNRLHLNLATVSLLFVIVIVALARVGNFLPSVLVSFLAALILGYMAPPNYSVRIDDALDA